MKTKIFIGLFFASVLMLITAAATTENYNNIVVVTIKGNTKSVELHPFPTTYNPQS